MKLAKRLENFNEYAFSILAKKKAEIERKTGKKVLDLSIGSPDFPPSRILLEKLKEFSGKKDFHKYPGYGAIPEFSRALINWYKERFDVVISEDEIFPLIGAKDGVSHIPLALLDQGDEVLIPNPGYPGFTTPAEMIGAKPVFYDLTEKNKFKFDLEELKSKISNRTRFIWINFPANPTGQTATVDELKEVVSFAKKNNIWLVFDNAYSEITFDGFIAPSILSVKEAADVAVEIGSFSKTFSLAGDRMGWIAGNREIIKALAKVKSQFDSGLSLPLQKLGAFALNNFDDRWHKKMISSYENRRNIIIKSIAKIGLSAHKTNGSLYLWTKIPESFKDSNAFCLDMLNKKQVLFAPGTIFGSNGKKYIRISICANIDNIKNYFK